jgi:hypothetical protein
VELHRDVLVNHWNRETNSADVIHSVWPIHTRGHCRPKVGGRPAYGKNSSGVLLTCSTPRSSITA